jgi:hypothetical protein
MMGRRLPTVATGRRIPIFSGTAARPIPAHGHGGVRILKTNSSLLLWMQPVPGELPLSFGTGNFPSIQMMM